MTDRPILFSAPMVRALVEGRKTQTRRVLKPWPGSQAKWLKMDVLHQAPSCYLAAVNGHLGVQMQHPHAGKRMNGVDVDPMSPLTWVRLPYAPGDRLWVREAHALLPATAYRHSIGTGTIAQIEHPTDGYSAAVFRQGFDRSGSPIWRPSIHMPRWASRLTLVVTDVRVQRLQEIGEADAVAEGVEMESADPPFYYVPGIWPHSITAVGIEEPGGRHAARSFAKLWDSLNAHRAPWDSNPWVCALTFSVHQTNINKLEAA